MSKSYKIILVILVVLLGGLIFLEANKTEPINWYPSYSQTDKIPLGTKIFYENLKEKFEVTDVEQPPFEFLSDSTKNGIYFFLNTNVFIDKAERDRLLAFVERGNTAVIVANGTAAYLNDTLELAVNNKIRKNGLTNIPEYNFTNLKLKENDYYTFEHDKTIIYFDSLNAPKKQTALGFGRLQDDNADPKDSLINFLENRWGKGKFLLHSSPEVFTNFFMLTNNNYEYAEKFLGYLDPDKTIYWDKHYKNGKTIQTSPLYVFLKNKQLKWAYYFVLIATILFILFEGKRKQKSIKVVEPLKNNTYDYARTIAGMYLDKKDYHAIGQKMIAQFFQSLNKRFKLNLPQDKQYKQVLENQTNNTSEEIDELFNQIKKFQQQSTANKKEVEELNQQIVKFKEQI